MKIVVLDGYHLNPGDLSWTKIERFGETVIHDHTAPEEAAERLQDADIAVINKIRLDKELLESAQRLRFVSVLATGYDVIDAGAARKRGIIVSNVPDYGTHTVAQFTFGLILELCHHIGRHSLSVRDGEWIRSGRWSYVLTPQMELYGKTLGIIGYGRIGRRVGELAQAFGMKVITLEREGKELDIPALELQDLLAQSDIVTLHCPLTKKTKGLIDQAALRQMKPSAFLINASRGPLIVEEDLRRALEEGVIAGAALDVLAEEPMRESHILQDVKNLIVTPHMAWTAKEARERIMDTTQDNIAAFLKGEPQNRVI